MKIMRKIDLRLINPRAFDDAVITPEEILSWFTNEDAFWAYEGNPSPQKAHAELVSGLCSDGFFDCLLVLRYPNIAEILGRQLARRLIQNGWLPSKANYWVVSSAYAAITFGHEVAKGLGAIFMNTEKDPKDPKKQIWQRMTIPTGAYIFQAEELITTSGTFQEVERAVNEGNKEAVTFYSPVGVLVHRPPKLPAVYEGKYGGRQVIALVEKEIRVYKPEECPYCAVGSPRYRPKTHWAELTGKK
jgi:orotate phosphoribosyltransferase